MNVLIGDIGGTNIRFALVKIESPEKYTELTRKFYETKNFNNLEDAIDDFLKSLPESETSPEEALLACAGSPINNLINAENLEWSVDANKIKDRFNLKKCNLINDFTAKGYSILKLKPEDIKPLQTYNVKDTKTKVVIGPGTGLGVATVQEFLQLSGLVRGTEYGHCTFGAISQTEAEFVQFYLKNEPNDTMYIDCEKAFSGPSIPWIYKFFCMKEGKNPENFTSEMVFEKGLNNTDPECRSTIDFFCTVYGRIVGDIALVTMPFGGIYLVGKMTLYLKDYITSQDSPFIKNYYSKGSITNKVLEQFPIYIVKTGTLGLVGATIKIQRDIYGLDLKK